MITSKEILEQKIDTSSFNSVMNFKSESDGDFKDYLVGFVSPTLHSFSNNLENFGNVIINSFKSNDDMKKIVSAHGNELRNIENRVIRYFNERGEDKVLRSVKAFKAIENDNIPYITTCDKTFLEVTGMLEKVAEIIKRTKVYDLKGFSSLSNYVERLMNSEDERTSKMGSDLTKTVDDLVKANSEMKSVMNNMFTSTLSGTVRISSVLPSIGEYPQVVSKAIDLTKTLNLGFVNNLKRECEKVDERIGYLTSYINDGTIIMSEAVSKRLLEIIDVFANFVSNVALISAVFLEYLESIIVLGEKIKDNM